MLKRYFWLAYLLLITAAAVMAADIANGYVTMRLSASSLRPPVQSAGTATTGP